LIDCGICYHVTAICVGCQYFTGDTDSQVQTMLLQ